jgi:hypothetical protein
LSAVAAIERTESVAEVKAAIVKSLGAMQAYDAPYRHWTLTDLLPEQVVDELMALPFEAQETHGVSGKRELHNDTRTYFDGSNIERFPVCEAVARAFHDGDIIEAITRATGADLDGTLLRLEYALDKTGYWNKPHTDLGVKRLTLLYYLAEEGQEDLGSDIYAAEDRWVKRGPFRRNEALMFVPSNNTWHGFDQRTIKGVRKSVILNYVTEDWHDRWQLSYADKPVRSASRSRTA